MCNKIGDNIVCSVCVHDAIRQHARRILSLLLPQNQATTRQKRRILSSIAIESHV